MYRTKSIYSSGSDRNLPFEEETEEEKQKIFKITQ